jgi:hypothetical protein
MEVVLQNSEAQIAPSARPSSSAIRRHLRDSFGAAYWALALALGIPALVFVFAAIRAREFKLEIDQRWTQFVPFIDRNESVPLNGQKSRGSQESGRIPVQTASILTGESSSPQPVYAREMTTEAASPNTTPPETDSSSREQLVEESRPDQNFARVDPEIPVEQPESTGSEQAADHALEIAAEPQLESVNDSEFAKSAVRLESEMREVRQKLDQLVDRLAMQHVEHRNEAKLAEISANSFPEKPSRDESIQIHRTASPDHTDLFTIDVQDADIRQFLIRLSEVARVGILPSPAVQGRISLHFEEKHLEAVLKAIVRSYNLAFEREHGIIVIRTADEAAKMSPAPKKVAVKPDGLKVR